MTAARLLFVGGGPRAVMILERLLARVDDLYAHEDPRAVGATRLHIEIVDPHPPGAGRIWRRAQSPLLKLNSMARDVTVFTDDSCTISGPIRPGPSLIDWAQLWRSGALPDAVIDDELAAAEARGLRGDDFPTRRLHSAYLEWFCRRTIAAAPPGVTVRRRAGTVTSVRPADGGRAHTVVLDGGLELETDVVVYAVGHNGREPDTATASLIAAAQRDGLVYVPPAFTADADLSELAEGDDVIVRGMGLAAVDLVVLLTQGRGGRFVESGSGDAGSVGGGRAGGGSVGLRYIPSGREPRLHLGSRRGVPYRSKVSSTLQGDPAERAILTPERLAALARGPEPVDFDTDVWPLIASELLVGYYRELFTGHPDRVRGDWPAFLAVLKTRAWDDPALAEAIARVVHDPRDRFDIASLDRPLAEIPFAGAREAHDSVRAHIVTDLNLRTTQEHSAAQGVFLAALLSFLALSEIPTDRWNARSRAVSLPVRWHTFFSYVASGPPAHRLEELLALADAGIVRFLGPDIRVDIEPGRGFVASSPRVPSETVARSLVDAWLPGSGAAVSENSALRELATVHGVELRVSDTSFAGTLGRVHTDDDGRVLAADGRALATVFASGPFTSATDSGAFTRPASNALPLRQTDRTAGAILDALALGCRSIPAPIPVTNSVDPARRTPQRPAPAPPADRIS